MGVTAQKERGGVMGAASSGATSTRRAIWPAANRAARDQMHRESTAPADEALMSQKAARSTKGDLSMPTSRDTFGF